MSNTAHTHVTTPVRQTPKTSSQPAAFIPLKWTRLGTEAAKFGSIGAIAYVIDTGIFNLVQTELPFIGVTLLDNKPITAKIVSATIATLFAWWGNRHWTYRDRDKVAPGRELVTFIVMNIIGMAIALLCLGISHYVLGFTSRLADNISGNVIGLVLGTLFRFYAYRTWVFPDAAPTEVDTVVDLRANHDEHVKTQ